jgi:SAM-dependent methyltransferase
MARVGHTRRVAIYDTRVPAAGRPLDHVEFGPGTGPDLDRRLLGDVQGRHVLVLGCGAGHDAVGLARRGAIVTAVDADIDQLGAGRELATREEASVAFHQAGLAELAFLQAEQMDLVVSVHSLCFVDDLDRVFRQVHRILEHGGRFTMSIPHPATLAADPSDPNRTIRPWDDLEPVAGRFIHRAEDLVTALHRANFEIDVLLERSGPAPALGPVTLIARGEKLGT